MGKSRTENSLRNVAYSFISYFIILLLQFVNRTVFIHSLEDGYLGLNGLFSNVLSFLSLAELGVGSAMNYALYQPIKDNNTGLIQSVMGLYKRLYQVIGCVVLALGGAMTPFLPYLIKDMPENVPHIKLYYILYVLNSGVSYFYTYKRSLIICNQKEYITSVITAMSRCVLVFFQIVVLVASHSYTAYLSVAIFVTVAENIAISILADRMYPYLREKPIPPLPEAVSADIKKNVFAMMFHKIGAVVVFSTDNIIISKFVGLISVGLYSNYTLIIQAADNLFKKIFTAITASVGNLVLSDDKRHVEAVFYRVLFLNFWTRGFCAIALLCLLQPFIALWVGEKYLLPMGTMVVIVINCYLTGMRKTVNTFRDASGNFWHDRYKPVIESILNVALSIPLAIKYGVFGVLLGTIGSTLAVPFWFEAYVLFKYCFHKGIREYMLRQALYGCCTFLIGTGCYLACSLVTGTGVAEFILRTVICLLLSNGLIILLFHCSDEYKYFWGLLKRSLFTS